MKAEDSMDCSPPSIGSSDSHSFSPFISTPTVGTPVVTTPTTTMKAKTHGKKPLTGYNLYENEVRKSVIEKNPDKGFREINKMIGADWGKMELEEKTKYKERAAKRNEQKEIAARAAAAEANAAPAAPSSSAAAVPVVAASSSEAATNGTRHGFNYAKRRDGLKNYRCRACHQIPDKEIFLCINGHSICHDCVTNSIKCPESQCGVLFQFVKVRNLDLEYLLDPIDFECMYKETGCNQVGKRADMRQHIKTCSFSCQNPLLCKMIGYDNCHFIPSAATRTEILEHFRTNHDDVIIQNGSSTTIPLENIRSVVADGNKDFWWHSCLMNFESNETGPLLLILSSTSSSKMTSWLCVLLWADRTKSVPNLFAEFSLEGFDDATPELKYTLPAIDIRKAKKFLEESFPVKVCNHFLIQHYLSDAGVERDIVLKVTLMRKDEPPVQIERNGNGEATTGTRANSRLSTAGSSTSVASSCFTRGSKYSEGEESTTSKSRRTSETAVRPSPAPSGRNSRRSGNSISSSRYIFDNPDIVACHICKMEPLSGYRYHCLQCEDVDLCSNCIQKGEHHTHIFVVIRNEAQNKELQQWISRTTSNPRILLPKEEQSDSGDEEDMDIDFTCGHCSEHPIVGRLYSCLTCPEEYYLCSQCFDQDEHSHSHLFTMTISTGQQALLNENRNFIAAQLRCKPTSTKRKRFE